MKNTNLLIAAITMALGALIILVSCSKNELPITSTSKAMTGQEVFDIFISPKILGEAMMQDDVRCPRQLESLDSLIATGYWLWYSHENGITTTYTEGQVGAVRADTALMRCGVMGYGSARMRLASQPPSSNKRVGVTHWPVSAIPGSLILEVYHTASGKNWIFRKDVLPLNQGLAFCTSFDGYANEGSQTGAIEVYYRDPEGDFFLANETNCTGVSILLTDANST
jgi:hypothetical protein